MYRTTTEHESIIQFVVFIFYNDTATTDIYTLSLHDALPIYLLVQLMTTTVQDESGNATNSVQTLLFDDSGHGLRIDKGDRKSTRLNSSHGSISYAGFCLQNISMPMCLPT